LYDVIVIGGGPAGATTAALLARGGAKVLVIEKEAFPRFHIGESLLPRSVPTLRTLGIDLGGQAFHYKGGAEFFDEEQGSYALYPFADAMAGGPGAAHAYQVERAGFDQALLKSAKTLGAEVNQRERVLRVDSSRDIVHLESDHGAYDCRYCVDATGQDAFFARRDRTTAPIPDFGRAAVFTHFVDLSDDAMELLGPDGNIKVLMKPDTWSWLIPLPRRRVSVGTVTRHGGVSADLLDDTIAKSPLMKRLSTGAERLETKVIRNFSYRNTRTSGVRHCSVGDAACFLDPVFSSGVALALLGAETLAERLLPALARGTEADPALAIPVAEHMSHAYTCVSALIHAFYHTRIVKNLFFAQKPNREMRSGLITMLAADLWRDDNPFQNALLSSRRRLAPLG
jgi:flavin-dependent dehydrogenase